jgi:hypothetical protein
MQASREHSQGTYAHTGSIHVLEIRSLPPILTNSERIDIPLDRVKAAYQFYL